MRFESVKAYAFGMLTDKQLDLAPGMTVIHGPNESGKSTWHAALYAGLCGVRRARGQPTAEEKAFALRYRPWSSETWEVGVRVQLDDSRRVELRHNLADRVGSRATDLTLGRDVTSEIIADGSPDGARWLGLDRRSFQATACVGQADILSILDAAGDLEQQLARAAATARTDATAAEAITRLEYFRDTYVGSDRAPTKPWRRAQERVRDADSWLEHARAEHQAFLGLVAKLEDLNLTAVRLREELRLHEAAAALRDAQTREQHATRVRELSGRFRDGPPVPLAEDDELAQKVAAAVPAWEGRPSVPDLQGPSAEELQRQIEALPPLPEGDLEPHPNVTQAQDIYKRATRSLELHDEARPSEPAAPAAGGASEPELLELARDLATPVPQVDPKFQERFDRARLRVDHLGARPRIGVLVAVGLLGALTGVGLAVSGSLVVGLLVLIATGVLVSWMVGTASGTRARALEELREAENSIGETRHAVADAARRKDAARTRAQALGVAADPTTLRSLAEIVSAAAQHRRDFDRWTERRRGLVEQVAASEGELVRVLRTRGVDVSNGVGEMLGRYLSQCADRARVALEAGRRAELDSRLAARLAADEARRRASEAERGLGEAAAACVLSGDDPDELCRGLKAWQQQHTESLEQHQTALQEWSELKTLLAGATLEEIEREAQRRREAGTELAEGLDPARISVLSKAANLDGDVIRLRRDVEQASQDAHSTQGRVRERAQRLPSVTEAEEEFERAKEELNRVLRLQRTLDLTLQFLTDAQERAHRNIAPILAQTVTRFLPEVTARRYLEAAVDPETLEVRVRDSDGQWRDAALLSHGTGEQVYLLLRVALAEHLARPGETCPLILDDATVQSDRVRTEAIMQCLHALSRERQVIVFTQEDEVLAWAQRSLDDAQDRLIRLDGGA